MDERSYVYATAGVIIAYLLVAVARRTFDPFAPVWLFLVGYVQVYVVQAISYIVLGAAYVDSFIDNCAVNAAFDEGCTTVSRGGRMLSALQAGRVQGYLRLLGLGFVVLVAILLWGTRH